MRAGGQKKLIDTEVNLPTGLVYRPDFITPHEEADIISYLEILPLEEAQYGDYKSKRRHFGFGWIYDHDHKKFIPGPPLPPFLKRVQWRIAKWLDITPRRVVEALINEYSPGSPIGWHRDNEAFEHIVGISLGGWARMRFRPFQKRDEKKDAKKVISLELEPRSAYVMQKDIRWKWQHSVAATKVLRYSITFRTLPKNIPVLKEKKRILAHKREI